MTIYEELRQLADELRDPHQGKLLKRLAHAVLDLEGKPTNPTDRESCAACGAYLGMNWNTDFVPETGRIELRATCPECDAETEHRYAYAGTVTTTAPEHRAELAGYAFPYILRCESCDYWTYPGDPLNAADARVPVEDRCAVDCPACAGFMLPRATDPDEDEPTSDHDDRMEERRQMGFTS